MTGDWEARLHLGFCAILIKLLTFNAKIAKIAFYNIDKPKSKVQAGRPNFHKK